MNKTCWTLLKNKPVNDAAQWIPTHRYTSADWPAKTYIHQHCMDTRCRLEDLLRAMADRDGWKERLKSNPHCRYILMMMMMGIVDSNFLTLFIASLKLLFWNVWFVGLHFSWNMNSVSKELISLFIRFDYDCALGTCWIRLVLPVFKRQLNGPLNWLETPRKLFFLLLRLFPFTCQCSN